MKKDQRKRRNGMDKKGIVPEKKYIITIISLNTYFLDQLRI